MDLGKFNSEEEAAAAYDRASVWCLGLTSRLNFPAEQQMGQVRCTGSEAQVAESLRSSVSPLHEGSEAHKRLEAILGFSVDALAGEGMHCVLFHIRAGVLMMLCYMPGRLNWDLHNRAGGRDSWGLCQAELCCSDGSSLCRCGRATACISFHVR